MSALGYLAVSYGLIWVLIAVYVWFIGHRQAALRRQIEALRPDKTEKGEQAPTSGESQPTG